MKGEELKRIEENKEGQIPKGPKIIITAKGINNPTEILENTMEIIKNISEHAHPKKWPSDEEWKSILPLWFVESMTAKSSEDRDKDPNLWHFESWIDNIRQRFWVWYSSKIEENSIIIVLEALSIPYLHDTLVYILYSQGIPINNINIEDDVYDF